MVTRLSRPYSELLREQQLIQTIRSGTKPLAGLYIAYFNEPHDLLSNLLSDEVLSNAGGTITITLKRC